MKEYSTLQFSMEDGRALVALNRPDVHNAFNDQMLSELVDLFGRLRETPGARVVVVTGRGKSFCAGADLVWMKKMVDYSYEENIRDSNQVSECMYLLHTLPQPTIARVNGAAVGGGMGLVTACDIAIASEEAVFGLSEVKLGLVPAVISPYVLKKAGEGRCREYFLTGERLSAERALAAGLVNRIAPPEELDSAVGEVVRMLLSSGPDALAVCKELLNTVPGMSLEEAKEYTVRVIADLRIGAEGQEGMNAFLEKRPPSWRER